MPDDAVAPPSSLNFRRRVLPELRDGFDLVEKSDVAFSRDAEGLARLRGTVLGRRSPTTAAPSHPAVIITDHLVEGAAGEPPLLVRTYRPRAAAVPLPGVCYFHGGGMVRGSVARDDAKAARLAEACEALVASVDYRLAPENPFPAGVEDCYRGLVWLHDKAAALGVDASRLAVLGSSAGGGLAAAVALMARDRGGPPIAYQALYSPMLDDRTVWRDTREFAGIPGWSAELSAFCWECLLPGHAPGAAVSPYAAPARAADLGGLPPAFVLVGELELFRDEALAYTTRLIRAGVPVELHLYPGAYHGWELFNPEADVSRRAAAAREAALRAALHAPLD